MQLPHIQTLTFFFSLMVTGHFLQCEESEHAHGFHFQTSFFSQFAVC